MQALVTHLSSLALSCGKECHYRARNFPNCTRKTKQITYTKEDMQYFIFWFSFWGCFYQQDKNWKRQIFYFSDVAKPNGLFCWCFLYIVIYTFRFIKRQTWLLAFVVISRIQKHYKKLSNEAWNDLWKCVVPDTLSNLWPYMVSYETFKPKITLVHFNVSLVTRHHFV